MIISYIKMKLIRNRRDYQFPNKV